MAYSDQKQWRTIEQFRHDLNSTFQGPIMDDGHGGGSFRNMSTIIGVVAVFERWSWIALHGANLCKLHAGAWRHSRNVFARQARFALMNWIITQNWTRWNCLRSFVAQWSVILVMCPELVSEWSVLHHKSLVALAHYYSTLVGTNMFFIYKSFW